MPLTGEENPILYKNPLVISQKVLRQGSVAADIQHKIPSWNTAGRPASAKEGTIGFNFQTSHLEIWTGINWVTLKMTKI